MARASAPKDSTANLGFEAKLWLAADKLRNNMDAAVTERSDKRRRMSEPYKHADTFRSVQHPDLRADYVLANPPFNDSDWFRNLTVPCLT